MSKLFFLIIAATLVFTTPVFSQFELDLETGAYFSGYNDVRIPGDIGTLFSLSEDLDADPGFYYRVRLFYNITERHHIGALYAPLTVNSSGSVNKVINFNGGTFPANIPLEGTFQFNSYRLTYRYDFLLREKIEMGIGFTAKIRDAKISLKGAGINEEKTNVGFVPIIHFRLLWKWSNSLALLLEGDALAAPQGRAEDVLLAFQLKAAKNIDLKAGYRLLEGGADNDEVYTFALVNYAAVGAIIRF
jgi:hypothetical protein